MRYLILIMTFVICFTWITVTAIEQGRIYRVNHEQMIQELILKKPLPPDGVRIPGGVEIRPGMQKI